MNLALAFFLAFGVGFVAGLRSMTAPAVVAWAAHRAWIDLSATPLAFMTSTTALWVFTLGALGEYVVDKLPFTPSRTSPIPLIVRIGIGSLTGSCLSCAAGASPWLGALAGATGAIAGAFAGHRARARLVQSLRVPDAVIAFPEDLIALGLGWLLVSRI
jgi:uncharacterized membrane protein